MSKLPNSNRDTGDDTGVRPTEDRPPSTPRWVKVSGMIAIVLVLLFVVLEFFGGGGHGPGRHMPFGGGGGHSQHTTPIEQEVKQP